MKYIVSLFPYKMIVTRNKKKLFGIIYSVNYFFLQSRFFRVSISYSNFCEVIHVHTLSLPLALGIYAYCARLPFSIISRLKILKFYSSPSSGRPPSLTFLIILFSHTCIVWFLSKEIDLGSIFFSVSNMLSVNGHYYSWPFWL